MFKALAVHLYRHNKTTRMEITVNGRRNGQTRLKGQSELTIYTA
jgi:hypothetical protein